MSLAGSVESFPLRAVMSLLESTSARGVLRLSGPAACALHVDGGGLVGWTPEPAADPVDVVARVLAAPGARFDWDDAAIPEALAAALPLVDVQSRAEVRAAEWAEMLAVAPSPAHRVVLVTPADSTAVTLEGAEWQLVCAIAGGRSIEDLAGALGLGLLRTHRAVGTMVGRGLLGVVAPDHRPSDHRPSDHRPSDHRPTDHRPGEGPSLDAGPLRSEPAPQAPRSVVGPDAPVVRPPRPAGQPAPPFWPGAPTAVAGLTEMPPVGPHEPAPTPLPSLVDAPDVRAVDAEVTPGRHVPRHRIAPVGPVGPEADEALGDRGPWPAGQLESLVEQVHGRPPAGAAERAEPAAHSSDRGALMRFFSSSKA